MGRSLVRGGTTPASSGGGAGGAPTDAQYLVAAAHADLSAERVTTDTATVAWDHTVAGQAKANVPDAAVTLAKMENRAANTLIGSVAGGVPEEVSCTAAGRALLDDADAAAQRTTLGVGTGDSPQFAAVNIGAATDTTITRTGAGDLAVEGNAIYRAGGTDVPIADGGTGASTAAAARTNLGVAPAQQTLSFAAGDSGGYNPVDATPFYLGLFYAPTTDPTTTAPTAATVVFPSMVVAGTIKEVRLVIVVGGTLGSAQTGTGAIRINNGTDTVVFNNTLTWTAVTQNFSATGLSIALAAGDFFSLKITPPTWATEPTATFYSAQITVSFP